MRKNDSITTENDPLVQAIDNVIHAKMRLTRFRIKTYAAEQRISSSAAYLRFTKLNSVVKLAAACRDLGLKFSDVVAEAEALLEEARA